VATRSFGIIATLNDVKSQRHLFAFTMKNQEPTVVFDRERASAYDKRFAKLAPLRDAIHLLMHMTLSEFPTDAHILSVGAGTGAELIYLAQNFPQ